MIALAFAAVPISWTVYHGGEFWRVVETTRFAHTEKTRSGSVEVKFTSRTKDRWNDLSVVTTWTDGKKQFVRVVQNPEDGELRCMWVKGTEESHVFEPPITVFPGRNARFSGFRVTPTLRPFGHCTMTTGKSLGYDAPELAFDGGTGSAESIWSVGNSAWPKDMILRGEYSL